MTTNLTKLLLIPMVLFGSQKIYAQGCSDAGFCTLSTFKPINSETLKIENTFKIESNVSFTRNKITVFGSYLEYNRKIDNNFGIDAKLTSIAQTGNEVSAFGLADLYLNANSKLGKKTSLSIGTKLPLSNGNKTKNGLPLPMDYQASLGTLDFILGLSFAVKNVQFAVAIQQPFVQNKNSFIAQNYPTTSKLSNFSSTNNFKRSGDVLLRSSYSFYPSNIITITPSLFAIYHLKNDTYLNALNAEKEILESKGLTLNSNVFIDFELKNKNALQVNIVQPFLARKATPDGLQRSFALNVEYKIRF